MKLVKVISNRRIRDESQKIMWNGFKAGRNGLEADSDAKLHVVDINLATL